MSEALSVGVHAYLLPQLERLGDILLPDALDAEVSTVQYSALQYSTVQYSALQYLNAEVGELYAHLLVVDVHGADSLLAAVPPHAGRAHQVVRVRLRHLRVVRHTAAEEIILLELQTKVREDFTITENAPTRKCLKRFHI